MNPYTIVRTKKVQTSKFELRQRDRAKGRQRDAYRDARALKRGQA